METPATSSPPSQVPCVGPIQGPGTSVGRITIITSLADLVTRAVMTTNDQPVAPHLCSPLVEGHGLEVPDTFIVIDPDDSAFGVVRPEARMLRSSAAANSAAVALGTESAASSVDGPALGVGDQPTPKVETQPHTGDIAPEPVLGVPSSEKTPHEAKEPPTSGSASVDGVFDPAISSASISGVMHQIGDIGQHGLRSSGSERTGSSFEPTNAAGSSQVIAGNENHKSTNHAGHVAKATVVTIQVKP